jgi:hypothetical protein
MRRILIDNARRKQTDLAPTAQPLGGPVPDRESAIGAGASARGDDAFP